jgi:hypothetical protein
MGGSRRLNRYLLAFIIGFGVGAGFSLVFGFPIIALLSFFGGLTFGLGVGLALALVAGLIAGIIGVFIAFFYDSIPPKYRIVIALGILAVGIVTFQPEIDVVGAVGLALVWLPQIEEIAEQAE